MALSAGVVQKNLRRIQILRTAAAFGLAQALMPFLGFWVGRSIVRYIDAYDHWVVFGLLLIIGGRMLWEAFHEKEEKANLDITRGLLLLSMSLATSIDSLAVGLSFAFLEMNIVTSVSIIGAVAFLITILGFYAGRKAGEMLGKRAKILGGLVLIAIGIRVLVEHLTAG
ncbi:MAG TPA: manganese efflux pump MntP family protein [Dehalococcoidales bacterium]|nr:manganese efflux pump MntP family protein [Dehalococcoidales bacterium]